MSFTVHRDGALEYLRADALAGAIHCFSTRFGGVSTGYLKSLNLGVHRGDTPENVEKNYEILGAAVGFRPENLVFTHQIHSDIVRRVGAADRGEGLARPVPLDCDGLITDEPDVALAVFSADCTPILLHDPVRGAVGAVHAGWRGTAQKIAQITAQKLINEFGSNPKDICVLIGPAICGKCYEVGEEVYSIFSPSPLPALSSEKGGLRLDLKKINAKQLADIGIEKIDICPYCTCCDNEYFFSYRKENGTTLRHSAVLKLN